MGTGGDAQFRDEVLWEISRGFALAKARSIES
jgi:hypothetical protein